MNGDKNPTNEIFVNENRSLSILYLAQIIAIIPSRIFKRDLLLINSKKFTSKKMKKFLSARA